MERLIILNGINNKNNGVLRLNDTENYIKLNLNIKEDNYILVLKSNKTIGYKVDNLTEVIPVDDMDLSGELVALLLKEKEGLLYGAVGTDRMQAFSLLSFYKKNPNKIKIKEVKKYETKQEKVKNNKGNNGRIEQVVTRENDNILEENTNKKANIKQDLLENEKDKIKDIAENISLYNDKFYDKNDVKNEEIQQINNGNIVDKCKEKDVENCDETSEKKEETVDKNVAKIIANKNEKVDEKESLIDDGLVYKGDNFYLAIHNQIDEIFVCYKEETILNKLVENSRWARIDYSKDEYYVIGIIKENEEVKYICYGIPGVYSVKPPKEVNGFAKWLSIEKDNPKGNGYWIIYQDAKNGNTLKVE